MAIRDLNSQAEESLNYEYFLIDSLEIRQFKFTDPSADPEYDVILTYRKYAIDSNGVPKFKEQSSTLPLSNLLSHTANTGEKNQLINAVERIAGILLTDRGKSVEIR